MAKQPGKKTAGSYKDGKFPLPVYKKEDDIYSREQEETFSEEDDVMDDNPGGELDIPGAELDDANEETGEEDEENNYYSIGGDNHEDLETDQGD